MSEKKMERLNRWLKQAKLPTKKDEKKKKMRIKQKIESGVNFATWYEVGTLVNQLTEQLIN